MRFRYSGRLIAITTAFRKSSRLLWTASSLLVLAGLLSACQGLGVYGSDHAGSATPPGTERSAGLLATAEPAMIMAASPNPTAAQTAVSALTEPPPTVTPIPSPPPTREATPITEPTAIPDNVDVSQITDRLPYELAAPPTAYEGKYLTIALGVQKELTDPHRTCESPVNGLCPVVHTFEFNTQGFPDTQEKLEEAVLISLLNTYQQYYPDQYGDMTLDSLKQMLLEKKGADTSNSVGISRRAYRNSYLVDKRKRALL